ncbi:MAG: FixH family protein [Proteobacteria bacterium]|nr:FixH family protein [Pseudomonadota bacterium]
MQLAEESKPWHKHPLVWMMIAIPFSAVIMGVVMIWLAVDTDDGLVADDYYKRGLAINSVIIRDEKAAELGLKATIEFSTNSKAITLRFDKGLLPAFPPVLELKLQHATRANSDITIVMNHGIDDGYIGNISQPISKGVWYFEIADADWKINSRYHVAAENLIQLQSDY